MENTPNTPNDTPPTHPPAPPAEPNPDTKPVRSAYVRRLMENSAGIQPVEDEDPPALKDDRPLHVRMAELAAETEQKNAETDDAGEPNPKPAPAATEPPPSDPAKPAKRSRLIKMEPAPSAPTAAAPAPPPQPPAAPEPPAPADAKPAPKPVEDPNEGLTEDQVDRIKVLEFAEQKHPDKYAGKTEAMREYFRKEIDWQEKNPEPLESEVREFVNSHMPKLSASELRKIENEMLLEEAQRRAEEKLKPEIDKINQTQAREKYLKEVQPVILSAVTKLEEAMLDPDADVPGGFEPYFAPIGEVEKAQGPTVAADQFPIEYPIYRGTKAAAEEYMKLVTGVVPFDARNTTHAWLADFQNSEERKIMADTAARTRNGKTFATQYDYAEMLKSDPVKAAKHFTVDPEDILNAMVVNAHKVVDDQVQKLVKAGFQRAAVTKQQQPATPAAPAAAPAPKPAPVRATEPPPAPKATPTRQPGAADVSANKRKGGMFSTMVKE